MENYLVLLQKRTNSSNLFKMVNAVLMKKTLTKRWQMYGKLVQLLRCLVKSKKSLKIHHVKAFRPRYYMNINVILNYSAIIILIVIYFFSHQISGLWLELFVIL